MRMRNGKTYYSELLSPLTDDEMSNNFKWIKYGLYFGYPVCCIVAFVQRFNNTSTTRKKINTRKYIDGVDGHGYVPCDACHCKLVSGLSIHKLLVNRKHRNLFPNDN
jgi:hypothetical protein